MKFTEIPDLIEGLTFDGQMSDRRIHYDKEIFAWGRKRKDSYKKAEKEIDGIEFNGTGWQLYATYDLGGFDYWMKDMREQNYINLTIAFDEEEIGECELEPLRSALEDAIDKAYDIVNYLSYDPSALKYR